MTPYLRREEQVEEAEISSGGMAKIDAVYSEGGAQTAIQTVENDFNVRVDQYVWRDRAASALRSARTRESKPRIRRSGQGHRRRGGQVGGDVRHRAMVLIGRPLTWRQRVGISLGPSPWSAPALETPKAMALHLDPEIHVHRGHAGQTLTLRRALC